MSDGQTTVIANPNDPSDRKSFTFDHSYWSFDGFEADEAGRFMPDVKHPRGSEYCDQVFVHSKCTFNHVYQGIFSKNRSGFLRTLAVVSSVTHSMDTMRHCSRTGKRAQVNLSQSWATVPTKVRFYNFTIRRLLFLYYFRCQGILPQFCNRLFQNIEERTLNSTKYEIHLSMLVMLRHSNIKKLFFNLLQF